MILWGDDQATTRPATTMPLLRQAHAPQAVRQDAGGFIRVQAAKVLRSPLYGAGDAAWRRGPQCLSRPRTKMEGFGVRTMRRDVEPSRTSSRRGHHEQRPGEHRNRLCSLSHEAALDREARRTPAPSCTNGSSWRIARLVRIGLEADCRPDAGRCDRASRPSASLNLVDIVIRDAATAFAHWRQRMHSCLCGAICSKKSD